MESQVSKKQQTREAIMPEILIGQHLASSHGGNPPKKPTQGVVMTPRLKQILPDTIKETLNAYAMSGFLKDALSSPLFILMFSLTTSLLLQPLMMVHKAQALDQNYFKNTASSSPTTESTDNSDSDESREATQV